MMEALSDRFEDQRDDAETLKTVYNVSIQILFMSFFL
jgi:hypothetical protein